MQRFSSLTIFQRLIQSKEKQETRDMNDQSHVWQRQDLAKLFLEDVRAGIPLAAEQIDVLLRTVRHAASRVERLLDLGCGDGILGRTVLSQFPDATGVFVDFSEPMIEAARKKADPQRATFAIQDLASPAWTQSVGGHAPFDVVLSGLAIHHLDDKRKQELYREVFDLLRPGGLFLNLEHVAPRSAWAQQAFDDLFVDSLWRHQQQRGGNRTREEVSNEWYHRPDKTHNLLAPMERQCQWLREIGFQDVDCFFKLFQLALFGGKKPE
jgi:tRNA (cmo5U34)-methyltransferase